MLQNGADLGQKDDAGRTALDYARTDDAEVVINLLENFEKDTIVDGTDDGMKNRLHSVKH